MKNLLQILVTFAVIGCSIHASVAQAKRDTITFKKGEILDILLLSQHPDTEASLKEYFQKAFPVAKRMTYQPLPGFRISSNNDGNLQPNSLILGKWSDKKVREDFLTQILEEVPDFHERRRHIWSYFGLRYFEMEKDGSFVIDRSQYHVATAYWLTTEKQPSTYFEKWKREIENEGGSIVIQLTDGISPFGYQYNPEYFVITSWESKAAFNNFKEKLKASELDNIQHVNEFILN